MKIDDKWIDKSINYIEFMSKWNTKHSKIIVVDAMHSVDDISEIILLNFNNVVKINFIDFWDECLFLKGE